MDKVRYQFNIITFKKCLNKFLENHSVRWVSDQSGNTISPSTISRISTGKKLSLDTDQLTELCHMMNKNPIDFFDRMMF